MNSIERVKAAMRFTGPDRVPVWKAGLGDVFPMPMLPSKLWRPGHAEYEKGLFPYTSADEIIKLRLWKWHRPDWAKAPAYKNWLALDRQEVDEWGIIWNLKGGNTSIGHPGRAVLSDWSQWEEYQKSYAPDPDDASRYALFVRLSRIFGRNRYRMCILGNQGPFTTAAAIRGFIPFLTDHRLNPGVLKKLLAHVAQYYVKVVRMWVKYGDRPHGFVMYDDLADQHSPFISPRMFREFYAGVYRPIFDAVHALGCDMHFHSCGNIAPLLPTLLEWGVDALELDSPYNIGYSALQPYRGKIMIWACINIQTLYTQGTPEACEQEVLNMIRNLGTPRGGFGAYFYPQPHHIRVPKANIRAFERGLKKYGDYSRIVPGRDA